MPEAIITIKASPKYIDMMRSQIIEQIDKVEIEYGRPVKRKLFPNMLVFIFEGTKEEVLKFKNEQGKTMGVGNKVLTRLIGIKISARVNLSEESEIDKIEGD
jgi:hypothetical protein